MGEKRNAPHRPGVPVAGRCLAATAILLCISCTALVILLLRSQQEPISRDVLAAPRAPELRTHLTQVDTRGVGIQHVVLGGYHGGLPVVLNVWFRVLCAGSFTVFRGFATAEEAGGPLPVLLGHTLPPNAVLMDLPQIYVQLADGTRRTLTTWGPLEPGRLLPRGTWHLQATYSADHAAALIGVTGWDQTVQVPPQPRCHPQQQQQQQQQGPGAAPWLADGSTWGVLALPPTPTPQTPCAAGTLTTTSSSTEGDPLASPSALQEAVAATLASLTAAGAQGLLLVATNPSHVAQLVAAPGLQDTPLRVWLWDGPLHLQHTRYATNAAINAALLAAWGTGSRLLVLESPGDTLVTAPGQQLANATSPGGCLAAPNGQVHLSWSSHTPGEPQQQDPAAAASTRMLMEAPADSTQGQHLPFTDAAALKDQLVTPTETGLQAPWSHPATFLDPDVTTCWHSGDAAVIPPRLANQLLLPSIAALQAQQAASPHSSNSSVAPGGTSATLSVLYHTREAKGVSAVPPVVPIAPLGCAAVVPARGSAPGVTTPCPKHTQGGDTEAGGGVELLIGSKKVHLAGPSSSSSSSSGSEGRKALQQVKPRVPKVALLFITQKDLPLEPLWRAWLEAAGRVQLITPPNPTAAGDSAGSREDTNALPLLQSPPATYHDALGPDRELFPDLGVWEESEYPWSKVQRGEWKTAMGIHHHSPPLNRPAPGPDELQLSETYLKSGMVEGWEPQVQAGMHSWEFWPVLAEQRRVWAEYQAQLQEGDGSSSEAGKEQQQRRRRLLMQVPGKKGSQVTPAGATSSSTSSTPTTTSSSRTSSEARGAAALEKGQLQLQPRGPSFLVEAAADEDPVTATDPAQQLAVEFAAGGVPGTDLLEHTRQQQQGTPAAAGQVETVGAAAPTTATAERQAASTSSSSDSTSRATKAEGEGMGASVVGGTKADAAAAAVGRDKLVTWDPTEAEGEEVEQTSAIPEWDELDLTTAPAPRPSLTDFGPAPTPGTGPMVHDKPPLPPLTLLPTPQHPLYTGQDLFSVYIHALPGVVLPPGSVFSGRQVGHPVNTTTGYASFLLTKAIQRALQVALQDPDNVKFAIMSETSIPLYHPKVLWAQLMSDHRSFISACNHEGWDNDVKWHPAGLTSDHFNATQWRKSSTWSVLSRPHADLVAQESHVMELFQRYCSAHDNNATHSGACTSDEIAIPSLLAAYNLSHQTNCGRDAQFTHWSGGWHPHSFLQPWEVSSSALHTWRTARGPPGKCDYTAATQSTRKVFETPSQQKPGTSRRSAPTEAASWLLSPSAAQQYLGPGSWGAHPGVFGAWEGDSSSEGGTDRRRLLEDTPGYRSSDPGDSSDDTTGSIDSSSSSFPGEALAAWLLGRGYQPMDPTCSLFARKFKPQVVNATLALGLSCQGLGLGHWCD